MTATPRSSKPRRKERSPSVWYGDAPTATTPRTGLVSRRSGDPRWRIVSGLLSLVLMGVLVVFLISDVFTVRGVAVSGLTTMPREEIIRLTDVLGTNVFLLQPTAVRARLLADPAIADANVQVVLGSINVLLDVQEREPALIWERAGLQSWVDIHGYVTLPRSERPELLRIVDDSLNPQPPLQLSTDVVQGALQLQTLLPEQNQLRYSEGFGLGYTDPRGWQVWLGVGTDMPNRMLIYNAIVTNLQARGIVPSLIDVSDPQAVYYAVGL